MDQHGGDRAGRGKQCDRRHPLFARARRHWKLASVLGLSMAVVFATVVYLAVGNKYTATSVLNVATSEDRLVFETAKNRERFTTDAYAIYKGTQAQLIKSPQVLNAALEEENVKWLRLDKREKDAVGWLSKNLKVGAPAKVATITIGLTSSDSKEAEALVKAVTTVFLRDIVDRDRRMKQKRMSDLGDIQAEMKDDVRRKRGEFRSMAAQFGAEDTEALAMKQRTKVQQVGDYQRELMRTEFELRRAEGTHAAKQALVDKIDTLHISDAEVDLRAQKDPVARQLAEEVMWRQIDFEQTKSVIGPGGSSRHAEEYMLKLETAKNQYMQIINELRERIRMTKHSELVAQIEEEEIQIAVLSTQVEKLREKVEEATAELEKLSGSTIEMEMRREEIAQLDHSLAAMSQEIDRGTVELQSQSRITLLQPTNVPPTPSNGAVRLALGMLAGLVGLTIPVAAIAFWSGRSLIVNSSEDLSSESRLTVIGSLPMIPARAIGKSGAMTKRQRSWNVQLIESVDGIAARLLHKAKVDGARVIMVSSAIGGEGKTTLATQLGMSLARSGRRTVIVDCDLRKPALHGVFGMPAGPGVSETLRGECDASEVTHVTAVEGLSVVGAGAWDRRSLTALANGAAGVLFEELREDFEFIIVDTSPILPVADTRFISQHVDIALLSVFRDVSQSPKISAACEILSAFGVETVDAVVVGESEGLRKTDMEYQGQAMA